MKKFQKVALVTALATLTATQVFAEEAAKEVMNDENVKVETKIDEKANEATEKVEEKAEEEKEDVKEEKDAVNAKDIKLVINGKEVEKTEEYASFIQENRTFVPIRLISEKLGFKVEWNDETKDITVTNGDDKVVFNTQKDTYIDKDGKEVKMDVKPVVKNNRTFLPIRFVSEALDIEITWAEDTRTVTVTQEEVKEDAKEEAKDEKVEDKKEDKTEDDKKVDEDKTETKENTEK